MVRIYTSVVQFLKARLEKQPNHSMPKISQYYENQMLNCN